MDAGNTPTPTVPGPIAYYIVYNGQPPPLPHPLGGNHVAYGYPNNSITNFLVDGTPTPIPVAVPLASPHLVGNPATASEAPTETPTNRPKLLSRLALDDTTTSHAGVHRQLQESPRKNPVDSPRARPRAKVKRGAINRYSGLNIFKPTRKAISLPTYHHDEDDGITLKHRWIAPDYVPGLNIPNPAPMVFVPGSRFQVMDQMFEITEPAVYSLSTADLLRLSRACRNTHPDERTDIMDDVATLHIKSLTSDGCLPAITTPYGFPERLWDISDLWIGAPKGIPFTVRVNSEGLLDWIDTATHHWVTQVTADRDPHLTNALLVLFTRRAAAMQYIWKVYIPPYVRPIIWVHLQPWPFRVPVNVAHPCNYGSMDISDLTGYLMYLTEVCQFPVANTAAVTAVCDWADAFLAGEPLNEFAERPPTNRKCVDIVTTAHYNQPWIPYMDTDGYRHY
jgi:hypothetical protein